MSQPDNREGSNSTSSQRHKACNQCRLRKVRCDGGRPFCKQCASGRAAWECFYPASARRGRPRRPSPLSPPSSLLELDGSTSTQVSGEAETMALDVALDPSLFNLDQQSGFFDGSVDRFFHQSLSVFRGSNLGAQPPPTPEHFSSETSEAEQTHQMQMPSESHQSSLDAESTAANRMHDVPAVFLDLLFETYFNTCQSTVRLFDNLPDFLRLTQQTSEEGTALRYAVIAHAVPGCPQFSAWAAANLHVYDYADYFYRLACEALIDDDCLDRKPSLRALQATILIGLYELHHAQFGRAWLTASRADWLTQTMQLRTLDSDEAPRLDNPDLLEEARRAQWATSSLACVLMKGGRMGDTIEEITTLLPQSPANQESQASGISIGDIFRNAAPRPLSVEEALSAAHVLTRRVVIHVRDTKLTSCWPDRQPYSFWTNQYRLEQTLLYLRNFIKTDPKPEPGLETMLDLYIKAWHVVLHEAKLKKTHVSHASPRSPDQERASEHALLKRTLELAEALQTCVLPGDAASSITVSWIVYVTLQSLLRCKRRKSTSVQIDPITAWHCSSPSGGIHARLAESGFEHTDPVAVTHALVLDSSDALRSMLAKLGDDSPIANFFSAQLEAENCRSDVALGKCLVGLVDFTAR